MECPQCFAWVAPPRTTCECGTQVRDSEDDSSPEPAPRAKPLKKRRRRRFSFYGTGRALFFITLRNIALTIFTAGIYRFWARAHTRRYTFSQLSFENHRFTFHGTGGEAFRGFVRLIGWGMLAVFGLVLTFVILGILVPPLFILLTVAEPLGVVFLASFVVVNGRRYVISRTSYRGIFFSFDGTLKGYWRALLPSGIATAFTLGLAFPFLFAATQNWLTNHTHYGTERFRSQVQGKTLMKPWLIFLAAVLACGAGGGAGGMALSVVLRETFFAQGGAEGALGAALATLLMGDQFKTIGIFLGAVAGALGGIVLGSCWLDTQFQRHVAASTSFQKAKFSSSMTTLGLLKVRTLNLLVLLFTGGLGLGFNIARTLRYRAQCLSLVGPLNLSAISQRVDVNDATVEGLLDEAAFDLG
ncbi:MAG: DUF898 family protein [Candidatus Sericytochromatia bacterium]|nr:DUF898 family protein [Candidatus Sericytochromatia bacterium]